MRKVHTYDMPYNKTSISFAVRLYSHNYSHKVKWLRRLFYSSLALLLSFLLVLSPNVAIGIAHAISVVDNSDAKVLASQSDSSTNNSSIDSVNTPDRDAGSSDDFQDPDDSKHITEIDSGEGTQDGNADSSTSQAVSTDSAVQQDDTNVQADVIELQNAEQPLVSLPAGAYDLNALWRSQQGGTECPLTIREGGLYCLTADISVGGWIVIEAPNADLTIDFQQYCLTAKMSSNDSVISVKDCASLTLVGKRSYAGITKEGEKDLPEQLVVTEGKLKHAIESSCKQLNVRDLGIALKSHKDYTSLEDLGACGVYLTAGKAIIENCSISIDHSTQVGKVSSFTKMEGFPKDIFAGSNVESVEVKNSDLAISGSPSVERPNTTSYSETTIDNAYGIYSEGDAKITLSGLTFNVNAPRGSAVAVRSDNASVERFSVPAEILASYTVQKDKDTLSKRNVFDIHLSAKDRAFGLKTGKTDGISIDSSVAFDLKDSQPIYHAAFMTSVENGFKFNSSFSGSYLQVLAGDSEVAFNSEGFKFASFGDNLSEMARNLIANSLVSGSESSACSVALDSSGLFFKLDAANAPVCIVNSSGSEKPYANITDALRSQKDGEKILLLKDANFITLDDSVKLQSSDDSVTKRTISIDLGGHAITGLDVKTAEPVKIFSSGSKGSINGYSTQIDAAVSYSGKGGLSLSDLDIVCFARASSAATVKVIGSGSVNIGDTMVKAISSNGTTRAISQTSGNARITIVNSSLISYSDTLGVNVYGIDATSSSSNISLTDSTIEAKSANGITAGINSSGSVEVKGSVGANKITAKTRINASLVAAIKLNNANSRADLTNVTLDALCDECSPSGAYWSLMSGAAFPVTACTWILDGVCSFNSAQGNHVNYKTNALLIGEDFKCPSRINFLGEDLKSNKICTLVNPGGTLTTKSLASSLQSIAGSSYSGWTKETDEASVFWTRPNVIQNETSGKAYKTLEDAISEVSGNDTLKLISNCDVIKPISITKPITLDLNRYQISFVFPSVSLNNTQVSGLSITRSGSYKIKNGIISVASEFSDSALSRNLSINTVNVSGSANLNFDGVTIKNTVNTGLLSAGKGTIKQIGIRAKNSSVDLTGGTSIQVSASGNQAIQAQGVLFESESSANRFEADSTCAISVQNNAARQELGTIANYYTNSTYSNANLMRFYPEEGSDLMNEIQTKFKEEALVDVPEDSAGTTYNTSLYYAAPMHLHDGTYVWAFSEPLPADEIGKLDSIRASVFYCINHHDGLPLAQAVNVGGAVPNVNIASSLIARSANGEAAGIFVKLTQRDSDKGKENISVASGTSVLASGSSKEYRKVVGKHDLRNVFNLDCSSVVAYPGGSYGINSSEVEFALPESGQIIGDDASKVKGTRIISGASSVKANRANGTTKLTAPPTDIPNILTLTFSNIRDSNGTVRSNVVKRQELGSYVDDSSLPEPGDYKADGMIYRFTGWSLATGKASSKTWRPERIGELLLDATTYTSGRGVELRATYVPVVQGECLVSFNVDAYIDAYGVAKGKNPEYAFAVAGSSTSVPSKPNSIYGITSGFAGWMGADGEDVLYTSTLPKMTEDCTYTAVFNENPAKYNVYCYTWRESNNGLVYTYTINRTYYGERGQAEADALAKEGDEFFDEAHVYEFEGWSPRRTDKESYYGFTVPVIENNPTYLYGVYSIRDRQIPVTFYVDGEKYAESKPLLATTTVNGAFAATGKDKPIDKSEDKRFRGWALSDNADKIIMGSLRSLASLADGEKSLELHAIYGSAAQQGSDTNEENNANQGEFAGGSANNGGTSSGNPWDNPATPGGSGISSGVAGIFGATNTNGGLTGSGGIGGPGTLAAVPIARAGEAAGAAGIDSPAIQAALAGDSLVYADNPAMMGDINDGEMGNSATGVMADSSEESVNIALVTLIFFVILLVAFGCWCTYRVWRNKKLDMEDDFFEPATADSNGEQVVF